MCMHPFCRMLATSAVPEGTVGSRLSTGSRSFQATAGDRSYAPGSTATTGRNGAARPPRHFSARSTDGHARSLLQNRTRVGRFGSFARSGQSTALADFVAVTAARAQRVNVRQEADLALATALGPEWCLSERIVQPRDHIARLRAIVPKVHGSNLCALTVTTRLGASPRTSAVRLPDPYSPTWLKSATSLL
jgi:hypothetical protein